MDNYIWYIIMIPCCAVLSGIGLYAWNRKKPMWFWIGSDIGEAEIADITAYNHANGIMWLVYSLVFWAAVLAGVWSSTTALILIAAGCVVGIPVLIAVHKRIYEKYKA